jgi:hypothetical protein
MAEPTPQQVLSEIEQCIRIMPSLALMQLETLENIEWLGRAGAAIEAWGRVGSPSTALINWQLAIDKLHSPYRRADLGPPPQLTILRVLHQAQNDLRMRTVGPATVAIGSGKPFQYFDELRKIIEQATTDILFVDPYLNAEFVTTYLPLLKAGVNIRLLGSKYMAELKAAANMFAKESKQTIEAREGKGLHDRWVIVDKRRGFLSGASFKDGGAKSQTLLAENVDVFGVVHSEIEKLWAQSS